MGYYAQNQEDILDKSDTVFGTLDKIAVGDIRTRLRDILAAFLFKGEDIDKKVAVLSGGERARLAMAKLMLRPHNLLALDEPTNHMDLLSKDILKQALLRYDGTLIIVSHDRDFLDGLVNKVYEFKDGKVKEHLGGISDFLERKRLANLSELERKNVVPEPEHKAKPLQKNNYREQKEQEREVKRRKARIERCENEISQLEDKLKVVEEKLAAKADSHGLGEMLNEYNELKNTLDKKMDEWIKLTSEK